MAYSTAKLKSKRDKLQQCRKVINNLTHYYSNGITELNSVIQKFLRALMRVNVCIFGFKGASTSKVIVAHNEMMMNDYDGQMIFGDLVGLKLLDIYLTGEEKPRKNLTQETCPDRGSNPGPLRDTRACYIYHLFHSGGRELISKLNYNIIILRCVQRFFYRGSVPKVEYHFIFVRSLFHI